VFESLICVGLGIDCGSLDLVPQFVVVVGFGVVMPLFEFWSVVRVHRTYH
jgi:hypothetical protein